MGKACARQYRLRVFLASRNAIRSILVALTLVAVLASACSSTTEDSFTPVEPVTDELAADEPAEPAVGSTQAPIPTGDEPVEENTPLDQSDSAAERVAFGSTTSLAKTQPTYEGEPVPVTWNVDVGPLRSLGDQWPGVVAFNAVYGVAETPFGRVPQGLDFHVIGGSTGEKVRASAFACPEPLRNSYFGTVVVGGMLPQLMCIALDPADLASPDTTVVVATSEEEVTFGIDGAPGEPWPVMELIPEAADGFAFGEPTVVEGAGGSLWMVQVDDWHTDVEVFSPDESPPGPDETFPGFDLTATLVRDPDGSAPAGVWDFGVLGRATGRVYPDIGISSSVCISGVGSSDDGLAVGESYVATVCTAMARADAEHPDLQIGLFRSESRLGTMGPIVFRRGGSPGLTLEEFDAIKAAEEQQRVEEEQQRLDRELEFRESQRAEPHWHSVYAVYDCNTGFAPPFRKEVDVYGVHLYGDDPFHVHLIYSVVADENAPVSEALREVGIEISESQVVLENGTVFTAGSSCEGSAEPSSIQVFEWVNARDADGQPPDRVYDSDFDEIRLRNDGQLLMIVHAPRDAEVPRPSDDISYTTSHIGPAPLVDSDADE